MTTTRVPDRGFWRSGGWVLVAGSALVLAVVAVHTAAILSHPTRAVGDGRQVESYGFRLQPAEFPPGAIVASGLPRDGLAAIVSPAIWSAAETDRASRGRGKYLVASDRVVGVEIAGQARAYPLRLLQWHEVANDTLAGEPIAVTYSPLCDSVVVFSRRLLGRSVEFGVSGLLLDSNLLLYDRRPTPGESSLWWQLGLRAVAGPATGATLEPRPAAVVAWGWWRELHPDTTVLAPDAAFAEQGKREPYTSYFGSDSLRFPVRRRLPGNDLAGKTPLVAVRVGESWFAASLADIARGTSGTGVATVTAGSQVLRFAVREGLPGVLLEPQFPTVHAFRFAWYAAHADDTTWLFQ